MRLELERFAVPLVRGGEKEDVIKKKRLLHKISRKLSQQTYQSLTGGLVYHGNRERRAGLCVIQSKLYVLLRENSQIDRTFNVV